jgi:4-hydroxybenzoyl-CoA reductase subunit beta
MKRRQQMPKTVISVMRLAELNQITGDGSGSLRIGASVSLTDICEHPVINRDYPVVAKAARTISTPILRNMGTIGGNLLLDTRCNYYDQNYEWRKGINFCLKKDGDVCWVAPGSSKCWAVQSSDLVPVMVARLIFLYWVLPRGSLRTTRPSKTLASCLAALRQRRSKSKKLPVL